MINIIFSIVLASISIGQVNIFEIDGIFSSAHSRSISRHIEEFDYQNSDLLVVQYSSKQFNSEQLQKFNKEISKQEFFTALWVGPYKVDIEFNTVESFDFVGFTPGVRIVNVDFDTDIETKFCSLNNCNFDESTISLSKAEGIYEGYIIVGSIGAFLENLSTENFTSNLTNESIKLNLANNLSSNQIQFIKPSLIERFYISISNPVFTYLFFILGFALVGLELFAIGPGLMAFIGGGLILLSSMPFEEFGINYLGVGLFIVAFLIYIKILSRGYFSFLGIGAFLALLISSLTMFKDYEVNVSPILLVLVSFGLASFYFIAIPTVIRSRLTTDTSAMTSFKGRKVKIIQILDNDAVLVKLDKLEIRLNITEGKKYKVNEEYIIKEEEGTLII